jgi:hypothetical protein
LPPNAMQRASKGTKAAKRRGNPAYYRNRENPSQKAALAARAGVCPEWAGSQARCMLPKAAGRRPRLGLAASKTLWSLRSRNDVAWGQSTRMGPGSALKRCSGRRATLPDIGEKRC